jgi:hypothetical protein
MNIIEAYITYAAPIAIFHSLLLFICIYCLTREILRLWREHSVFLRLKNSEFEDISSMEGEVAAIAKLTFDMSRKGDMPSPEIMRARLSRSLNQYDIIIRYCLNAFIISGLLGTLYNLWKLGPSFWSNLINGQAEAGQPAIGIAFSASVFGLSAALLLSLFDSFFVRYPRERFINEASSRIFDEASQLLPASEGAAVAQALQNFYGASEGFLTRLKSDHEKLSREFTSQVRDSSAQLVTTLDRISGNWEILTKGATESFGVIENRLTAQISSLVGVTSKIESALEAALPELDEARNLSVALLDIRAQAGALQNQITTQLGEYGTQWKSDLQALTQAHVERLENSYTTGWAGYEAASKMWHERNVKALQEFAGGISASIAEWEAERRTLGEYVNSLIASWRGELGRAATGVGAGLAELHTEVDSLKQTAAHVLRSYDVALQQLRELQSTVARFNAEVLNGTSLGAAVTEMSATVKDFKVAIIKDWNPVITLPNAPDGSQVGAILREVKILSADVAELKGKMLPRAIRREIEYGDTSQRFTQHGSQKIEDEKPSRFRRLLRRFGIGV